MAIQQLTPEQVRTMTIEEKDRWWLENVFRGDMPQLTLRSAISGMLIGGVLSLTNLYVGMKTGWTLGVGITSVILAFAFFKIMERAGLGSSFTILENNCMQSIATAAGYMTAPLVSSLAAYMMITEKIIPMQVTIVWMIAICLLGVLFAFPLKRRFINDEQHPFPEGKAAGIVMDALHTSGAAEGLFKAKILAVCGVLAAVVEFLKTDSLLTRFNLMMVKIPDALEDWFYWLTKRLLHWEPKPKILGSSFSALSLTIEPDHVMFAAGGLMGIRAGLSLLVGGIINYAILAPIIIRHGDIYGKVGADGTLGFGFKPITTWALWWGVALMTTSGLFSFFSKPRMIFSAFSGLLGRRKEGGDCLRHVELPIGVFAVGIPLVGAAVVYLAHHYFDVKVWHGIVAVPLVGVFALIAANATALTSITPTGAMGKLTQLTFAALAPNNITTNVATASITGEVAGNASNLLMDIKPGYMLGGKPRQQAVGHALGILAGAFAAVPIFYRFFLIPKGNFNLLVDEKFPFPGATVWKAVAEVLTRGIGELPTSAVYAAIIGGVMGILLEALRIASKGRFPLSAVGLGLAPVVTFANCVSMFAGSFFFWSAERILKRPQSLMHRLFVQNLEPVCGGIIAGGALMGIFAKVAETFFLSP